MPKGRSVKGTKRQGNKKTDIPVTEPMDRPKDVGKEINTQLPVSLAVSSQSSSLSFEEDEDYEYDDYEEDSGQFVDRIKILAFRIGDENYAVRMIDMQEVLTMHEITIVPRAPSHLMGITSLRGKVIPVIDLRIRLGIKAPDPENPRILVLSGEGQPVGIKIDSIIGMFMMNPDEIMPSLNTLTEEESRFIDVVVSVEHRFVSILNLDEILKI